MNTNVQNRCENVKFWIDNDLLFCELNHKDCHLTENQVIAYLFRIEEITGGKAMPLIIDIREFFGNFSPEAAKSFADSSISKSCLIVQAFITDTLNGKLLVGSYIRIYGNDTNIKIFDQMEAAVAYCLQSQKEFYV